MTTERVFIDTNVLIYARDDRYPDKQAAARHWLSVLTRREAAVVSPQVLGEFHSVALRGRSPVSADEARRTTLALETWCHGVTDIELIHAAWVLCRKTGFQWWDCLILAAAHRADCRYLLSEDYQHGREVEGTTILNPFRVGPEAILAIH